MIIGKDDPFYKGSQVAFLSNKQIGIHIKYLLESKRICFADLARNLKISQQMIQHVIYGRRRSRRVEAEIARILGHAEWNDVVMEARLAVSGVGKPTKSQIKKAKAQAIKEHQELINRKRKAFRSKVTKLSKEAAA